MKKIIVFLLTAVLCLTVLSVITMAAENTAAHHDDVYNIVKFNPIMDGERDPEYLYSREVTLRDHGENFAKGSIYYLWDDERLYFHVEVYDKTPTPPEIATNHEGDCIEMLFSLYNYDVTATNITSKQMTDIGDAQFRVMRDAILSMCTTLVDNGLDYNKHGGYGKYIFDGTNWDDPASGTNYIIHTSDANGYSFEGFVVWGDELQNSEYPIGEGSVIGLGIQVNDDNNYDNKRDKKVYASNSGPDEMSMSGNRATCGAFRLVDTGLMDDDDEPETADPAIIFALCTIVSAGGFTLFATKKAKKD